MPISLHAIRVNSTPAHGKMRVEYIPSHPVEYVLWSPGPNGRDHAVMDHQGRTILAKNLKALRDAFGMTQEDVAGAAQIDRSYVSLIETRKYAATVDMLDKIAPVFQLGIDELLSAGVIMAANARRAK